MSSLDRRLPRDRFDLRGRAPLARQAVVWLALLLGVFVVLAQLVQAAVRSSSPLAGGTLFLVLGLLAALGYGLSRDSSLGILVWLGAALVAAQVGSQGLLSVDRLAFLALVCAWFIEVVSGRRELARFGLTEVLLLAFVLMHLGSAIAPHELGVSGEEGAEFSLVRWISASAFYPFALFVLARQTMREERTILRFLWFLVWVGVYSALMNLFWLVGPDALVWPRSILNPGAGANAGRAQGIFLNSAVNGLVLTVCFLAAMYLAAEGRSRYRWVPFVAGLGMLAAILPTQTRSSWLAAIGVVLLCALLWRGFRTPFVVLLVVVGGVVLVNWSTFTSSDRSKGGVGSTTEAEDRINLLATGFWAIEQKPVFGWGVGRFVPVNTVHHKAWANTPWPRGYGLAAHDTQVGIGADLGLVGLALWLAILGSVLVKSWRPWRSLPRSGIPSRWLVLCYWGVFVAYLTTASLIDLRYFPFATGLFFVWAGMIAALGDPTAERAEQEDAEPSRDRAGGGAAPEQPARLPA